MSDQEKDQMAEVDSIEIEPLSEDALESVAGGASDGSSGSCCSCCGCSGSTATEASLADSGCSA
jgi:hypothetical protein